jgi:hypothetical protein
MHIWDTKAVEKLLKCKCTGSYPGCMFCSDMHGFLIADSNNLIVFPGHRGLLEEEHYLRIFGQSKRCCPKYYFNSIEDLKVNNTALYLCDTESDQWTTGTIGKIDEDKREFFILKEVINNNKKNEAVVEKFTKVSCKNIQVHNAEDKTTLKIHDRVFLDYMSSNLWYKGTILSISKDNAIYSIKYDDGDKTKEAKKVTKNSVRLLYNDKVNKTELFQSNISANVNVTTQVGTEQ